MEEKENKIIKGAAHVFMTYGLKSVNMDDMARHLGVSKKTLYQFVKDKEELVDKSVNYYCRMEDVGIRTICSKGLNAIDESLEMMKWVMGILQNIHPSVSYDMEKYFPGTFKKMKESRHAAVYECMLQNMKRGQKEGLYRKDLNADIISKVYFARMDVLFDQEIFPITEYRITDIYMEMYSYHIRGIASAKGQVYLNEKLKNQKK